MSSADHYSLLNDLVDDPPQVYFGGLQNLFHGFEATPHRLGKPTFLAFLCLSPMYIFPEILDHFLNSPYLGGLQSTGPQCQKCSFCSLGRCTGLASPAFILLPFANWVYIKIQVSFISAILTADHPYVGH